MENFQFGHTELSREEVHDLRIAVLSMIEKLAEVARGLEAMNEKRCAQKYAEKAAAYRNILGAINGVLS